MRKGYVGRNLLFGGLVLSGIVSLSALYVGSKEYFTKPSYEQRISELNENTQRAADNNTSRLEELSNQLQVNSEASN